MALCATSALAGLPAFARADTEPTSSVTEVEADHDVEALLQRIEQQLLAGHTLSPEDDNALTTWSHVLELPSLSSPGARKALATFAEHTRQSAEARQAAGESIAASDYSVFSDQASKLLGGTLAEQEAATPSAGDAGAGPAVSENTPKADAASPQEADRAATAEPQAADADVVKSTSTLADHAVPPGLPAQLAPEEQKPPQPQQAEATPAPTQADHAVSPAEAAQPQQAEATSAPTQTDHAVPPLEQAQPQQAEATPAPAQADRAIAPVEPAQPQQAEATPAPAQADRAIAPVEPAQPQQAEAAPAPEATPAPTQADGAVAPVEPAQPQQAEAAPAPTQADHAVPPADQVQPQQAEATPAPTQADRAVAPVEQAQPQQAEAAPKPTQADHAVPPADQVQPQQAEATPAPTQADRAVSPAEPAQPQQAEAAPAPTQADHAVSPAQPVQPQPSPVARAPMQVARGDAAAASDNLSTAGAGESRAAPVNTAHSALMPTMTPGLPTTERRHESDEAAAFARRGDAMIAIKDISAARKFYQYAANAGSPRAATALGETYDPAFLSQLGTVGLKPDVATAASWYRKAAALGDQGADRRLQALALGLAK